MDFGLAVHTDTDVRATQSGVVLGSPAYMSPEQVQGERNKIGPATDIYSLGVMLYELMTGTLPFAGSFGVVMSQILNQKPKQPTELHPQIDHRLEAICLKMMAKPIEDRFASMHDVAEAITRFLKGESISSLLVSPSKSTSSTAQERIDHQQEDPTQTVKEMLKNHDYEQAATILQQVPVLARSPEMESLLGDAMNHQKELETLMEDVELAIRKKTI